MPIYTNCSTLAVMPFVASATNMERNMPKDMMNAAKRTLKPVIIITANRHSSIENAVNVTRDQREIRDRLGAVRGEDLPIGVAPVRLGHGAADQAQADDSDALHLSTSTSRSTRAASSSN